MALSKTCGIRTLKQVDTLTTSMSRPFIRTVSASAYNLIKRLSKIMTPFLVFEENWDPNAVITLGESSRPYTRRQAARIALFHAYTLQRQSRRRTQEGE